MPNCIRLIRKGETKATPLQQIDEELCKVLRVKVHPVNWVERWDLTIQFPLALGCCWEDIKNHFLNEYDKKTASRGMKMVAYLEKNYVPDAYAYR